MAIGPLSAQSIATALQARIERRAVATTSDDEDWRWSYRIAAAVLHVFDPAKLRPLAPDYVRVDPFSAIFDDTAPAVGWRRRHLRSLKLDVRRAALKRLGSRGAIVDALRANPQRRITPLQTLFEAWSREEPIDVDRLSYIELENLSQLYDWGLSEFGGLPDPRLAEGARRRRSTVAVFEHLVDANFLGREADLQRLRDYAGVVSPTIWEQLRSFVSSGPQPALVFWGPGGVGKTALIGRFLMEHVTAQGAGWFPFAYLPFDSETLDAGEPFTLLVTAASQFATQIIRDTGTKDEAANTSPLETAFGEFRMAVGVYRDKRGALSQRAHSAASGTGKLSDLAESENNLYASFGKLLREIARDVGARQNATKIPVVLVFDTFEEVQYRAREHLLGLWQMLSVLQKHFPDIRIVIAGRGQPQPFTIGGTSPRIVRLGELVEGDAINLLRRLGVDDERLARGIAKQIGGNPLSLRLAARLLRDEPAGPGGEIAGLETRRYWIFNVGPELIRGQLYRRILDHIHDPGVRALAHPGMVLRRVTPALIEHVLAPVCRIEGIDGSRALELFYELRAEHALVRIEDDSSLRYREEVRRPVLELLAHEKPTEVKQIHQAAAAYNADSDNPVARAEEIYHRLMLGEQEMLGSRWLPGVEHFLYSAVDELPPEGRIWLAARMNIELPRELYARAELAEWERIYGFKSLEVLRHEGPAAALKLLDERKERTPESPLFSIQVRALLALGRAVNAEALLVDALASYPPLGNPGRLMELLWLHAQASLILKRNDVAVALLRRLAEMARGLHLRLSLVQALTEILGLRADEEPSSSYADKAALAAALGDLAPDEVEAEPSLVRLALVRLGRDFPVTIGRLASSVARGVMPHLNDRNSADASKVADIIRIAHTGEGRLQEAARNISEPSLDSVSSILEETLADLQPDKLQPAAIDILISLFEWEQTTLAGATLAGVDAYREPWETGVAREVVT